jgi:hypothetical protein
MSHLPDQPLEVPEREVAHDIECWEPPDMYWPWGVGFSRVYEHFFNDAALKEFEEELKRKEKARAELGGFGFR